MLRQPDGVVITADVAGADGALQSSGPLLVAPGQERGPGRGALRPVGVVLGEMRAFLGEAVDVGSLGLGMAVEAQVSVAQIVRHDQDDVRLFRRLISGLNVRGALGRTAGSETKEQKGERCKKAECGVLFPWSYHCVSLQEWGKRKEESFPTGSFRRTPGRKRNGASVS